MLVSEPYLRGPGSEGLKWSSGICLLVSRSHHLMCSESDRYGFLRFCLPTQMIDDRVNGGVSQGLDSIPPSSGYCGFFFFNF